MLSYEKMLSLLDLFNEKQGYGALSFEQIQDRAGCTKSTLYRYLKALTDAGLLAIQPGLGYVLGSRIVQLDRELRKGDPFILSSRPALADLVLEHKGVGILCRRFRDHVLCVYKNRTTSDLHSNLERGLVRPLFTGAASIAVLAFMREHQIRRFYQLKADEFEAAGFGTTLPEVKSALRVHRRAGWVTTTGQVTPGLTNVAAPIFDHRGEVLGSLSLTLHESEASPEKILAVADSVMRAAKKATEAMAQTHLRHPVAAEKEPSADPVD